MASLWTKFTDIFTRNKAGVVPQAPSGTGTTKYLREDGTWAEPSGSGGSSTLVDLEDVDISDPESGQGLVYNEETEKWENGDVASDMEEITYEYYLAHKAEIEASDKAYLVSGPLVTPSAAGGGVNIYSTEEQVVGKWVGGKPVYEKTFSFSTSLMIPSDQWYNIESVPTTEIEQIIDGKAYNNDGTVWKSLSLSCDRSSLGILFYYHYNNQSQLNYKVDKITIQYTKTTDTPASLVPYVYNASSIKYGNGSVKDALDAGYKKYSTTERIVGEWIDGKLIYEKTITATLSPSSNSINVFHEINSLDEVINYSCFMTCNVPAGKERRFVPQIYYTGDSTYIVSLYVCTDTYLTITYGTWAKNNVQNITCYITLQYTKTTD